MKALALLLLLAACGPIPRDPDGTLDHVRRSHAIRVGVVAGDASGAWRPLLGRIAARTNATTRLETGALEPLLVRLEDGELDLVVGGAFAEDTPWVSRVTLGPVIRREAAVAHHVAARNGENAWIMLIEREARALGHDE